jgi:hypothetical protein
MPITCGTRYKMSALEKTRGEKKWTSHILVEVQRHLGVLDPQHSVVELYPHALALGDAQDARRTYGEAGGFGGTRHVVVVRGCKQLDESGGAFLISAIKGMTTVNYTVTLTRLPPEGGF